MNISIKAKITIWFTLFIALITFGIFTIMITNRANQICEQSKGTLIRNVDNMASRLEHESFDKMMPPSNPNNSAGGKSEKKQLPDKQIPRMYEGGVHIAVYGEDFSEKMGQIPFEIENMTFDDRSIREITSDSEKYYIYDKKIQKSDGSILWVKGVRNISGELDAVNSTIFADLILIILLIAIAAVGGYYIINKALVPVSKISETAKEITNSNDLSRRILLNGKNDEIYELGSVVDEMLEKLESTFAAEKQFTSDASHELRTPVSVILSECEYALDCARTEKEYKESLEVIKRQSKKMSTLIMQLLAMSRMDTNTFSVNFKEVNVSELARIVCEEQNSIKPTGMTITENIEDGIIKSADGDLLARLFVNLISNALQYGKENGTVIVTLKRQDNKTVFSVEDNGIGIEKENLDKLWDRFFRVDKSRSSANGNMGLGLSMVKQIAEIHKGKMDVESKPDIGSIFTFTF